MKTFKEIQNYITEVQGKPYVKPYTTPNGDQGWKASNGKKLKFFGADFKKSALKHAGLQEDGAAPAAGAPGAGMSSGAPTNSTAGIKPSIDNPPVFKTKYKKENQKGVEDNINALRKMVTGVNLG